MTMLDRMRRHRGWLKWSLGIVVVTFVLLYIPAFMGDRNGSGAAPTDAVATVNGHVVTVATYQRLYQQRLQSLRIGGLPKRRRTHHVAEQHRHDLPVRAARHAPRLEQGPHRINAWRRSRSTSITSAASGSSASC